jgi:cysteine desulfurase
VEVSYLEPAASGVVSAQSVAEALREHTRLVSIMHANNEIGTLNPVAEIGALCREAGVLLHVDAAQSAGKVPIDVLAMKIDLLSLSAHKFYGPKGVGALYVRRAVAGRLQAQMHGGGHERGLRAGTLPTHQVVGMGMAAQLAAQQQAAEAERLRAWREQLWARLQALGGVGLNGDPQQCLPGALNVHVSDVEGEFLLRSLKDIALSTGSACTSASLEPSHVLRAIGLPRALALSSLRISLGRFTTAAEVEHAAAHLEQVIRRLRSPGH